MPADGNERGTRAETPAELRQLQGKENALKEINDKMDGMNRKINKIEEKRRDQDKMMKRIEEIIQNDRLINEEFSKIKKENEKLNERIKKIETDLEQEKIREKRNQLEIVGMPKRTGERLKQIVKDLVERIDITLNENEITDCYRLNPKSGEEGQIIVKMKERRKRDEIMKSLKRIKPKLSILDLEPRENKIYINEALTKKQKDIFFKVKQIAREKNWNKVWTFSGDTYIKMEKEGRQIKINSQEDIETLLK